MTTIHTIRELLATDPNWIATLETTYKIKIERATLAPHPASALRLVEGGAEVLAELACLRYSQFESPMSEPIVQECRGMVVDIGRKEIVAHPYNKFWNHDEEGAAAIDWSTARVQEKLDGSMMTLWWSKVAKRWCVSSSSRPTAGGPFGDSPLTFAEAFWHTFHARGMQYPTGGTEGACYMLELCAKANRVVVLHETPRLVLHGARWMETGKEVPRPVLEEFARRVNWEIVQEHPITSLEEALQVAETRDPIAHEGFVVVDAQFNRVKIKSSRYEYMHMLRGEGMTPKRAIELWQSGDTAEVVVNFPEFRAEIDAVHGQIRDVIEIAFRLWKDNAGAPDKKTFAMAVKEHRCSAIAFKLWPGPSETYTVQPTIDQAAAILRGMSVQGIQRMIEG